MVNRLCWNCHFFIADDSGSLLTGICCRKAPTGADFNSFGMVDKLSYRFDFGLISPIGEIIGEEKVAMHLAGVQAAPASCSTADTVGFNANNIAPYLLPEGGFRVVKLQVAASLLNSGAVTVGDNPILTLQPVSVRGDTQLQGAEIPIPIPPALVQPFANINNLFLDIDVEVELENPIVSGLVGFRVDLEKTGENEIAEAKNLKIGLTLATNASLASITPPDSKAKWAQITDGSTQYCGDFKVQTETIPTIPTP